MINRYNYILPIYRIGNLNPALADMPRNMAYRIAGMSADLASVMTLDEFKERVQMNYASMFVEMVQFPTLYQIPASIIDWHFQLYVLNEVAEKVWKHFCFKDSAC